MATPVTKSFKAVLERGSVALNYVIVRIPFDVAKTWGKRGHMRVKGDINGVAFRKALFPAGDGKHVLVVNKQMQAAAKVGVGDVARFRMEPDFEQRSAEVPAELAVFLAEDRAFRRWYEQLGRSMRAEIAKWVTDVKSKDARVRRAEQIAERLLAAMDAERDLPPILRLAFARNPRAWEGWQRMSASRRRGHLMGVFYYKTPEARARRIEKMLQDAVTLAEKKKE